MGVRSAGACSHLFSFQSNRCASGPGCLRTRSLGGDPRASAQPSVKPYRPVRVLSEAAAAAAAHYVLVQLYPGQKGALDAALQHSAAAISDAQEKSSALITGRALGANIYAIWSSDLSSAGAGSKLKTFQVREPARGTGANSVAWYWIVGQFIEAQRLSPIESARLYALVSMALSDVHAGNRDAKEESGQACAPCAAGAAIQVILESELGSASGSGMTLTGATATGAAYTSSRVREYGRGLSARGRACRRAGRCRQPSRAVLPRRPRPGLRRDGFRIGGGIRFSFMRRGASGRPGPEDPRR